MHYGPIEVFLINSNHNLHHDRHNQPLIFLFLLLGVISWSIRLYLDLLVDVINFIDVTLVWSDLLAWFYRSRLNSLRLVIALLCHIPSWWNQSFQMFLYFPHLGSGPIHWYPSTFAEYFTRSYIAISSLTTLFYMGVFIDLVDGLSRLSYDPGYQKHRLYRRTVDWEPIVPSYPSLSFPDTSVYDESMPTNVDHILYCPWRWDESLTIKRVSRSSS